MSTLNIKKIEDFQEEASSAKQQPAPLSDAVMQAVQQYFECMDGHDCNDLYALVMQEVERPLLQCVLNNCGGNQTRASELLGISRGNLRSKLRKYKML